MSIFRIKSRNFNEISNSKKNYFWFNCSSSDECHPVYQGERATVTQNLSIHQLSESDKRRFKWVFYEKPEIIEKLKKQDFTKFMVLILPDSEVLIDKIARVGLNLKFGLIWNLRNIANLIFFISYANFECAKL